MEIEGEEKGGIEEESERKEEGRNLGRKENKNSLRLRELRTDRLTDK